MPTEDSPAPWRAEGDGERVGLDGDGAVVELVRRDGTPVSLTDGESGLTVRDVGTGRTYDVGGDLEDVGDGVSQSATVADGDLAVEATYRFVEPNVLVVEGSVSAAEERAVDVRFSLPVERGEPTTWETSLTKRAELGPEATPDPQNDLPLAAARTGGSCLAYAVPPEDPCRFEVEAAPDPETVGLSLSLQFGLSPAGEGALDGRAPFRFAVDVGVDPEWGLRSALRRYYERHADWFETPVDRYGLWQILPLDRHDDPEHYVFHEAGTLLGDADTVEEFAENDGWELDDEHGSYTLPYTIPGHREINYLEALPEDHEAAMAALAEWDGEPVPFESVNHVSSFRDPDELRAIVENAGLETADGRRELLVRDTNWAGKSVTFPVNPNPRLREGEDAPTIAEYMLDTYVPELLSHPSCDGVYVDSLWRWGNFFNYREEHFAAATVPLTYADDRLDFGEHGTPGLFNAFSHREYLRELRERLHDEDAVLMGNGVRTTGETGRAFSAFALDVLGVELDVENIADAEYKAAFYRAVAHRKPVLSLTHGTPDEDAFERMWKLGLLYGVAPATDGPAGNGMQLADPDQDDLRLVDGQDAYRDRYVPVLRRLLEAGWRPVTGVRADGDGVRVERYGAGEDCHLVVYNAGGPTTATFEVDDRVLEWPGNRRPTAVLSDGDRSTDDLDEVLGGALHLGEGELLVARVGLEEE